MEIMTRPCDMMKKKNMQCLFQLHDHLELLLYYFISFIMK
jgi:hypothetical protein